MHKKFIILVVLFLIVIAGFNLLDIYTDTQMNAPLFHLIEEVVVTLITVVLITMLLLQLKKSTTKFNELKIELNSMESLLLKQSKTMRKNREAYSKIIHKQFIEWSFSNSEKETAYMLLKGLSLKEIAELRGVKEKSVRQQSSNLYTKANLEGRHQLSAWFFEDFVNL